MAPLFLLRFFGFTVGHTALTSEGHTGPSKASPKGCHLEVGDWRASKLLVLNVCFDTCSPACDSLALRRGWGGEPSRGVRSSSPILNSEEKNHGIMTSSAEDNFRHKRITSGILG